MDSSAIIIYLIFVIALIILGSYYLFTYLDFEIQDMYRQLPNDPSYQNPNRPCPEGCIRGECQHGEDCYDYFPDKATGQKCCGFDFQCKNCRDPVTGQVYAAKVKQDPVIDKNYYANGEVTLDELNKRIARENKYIRKVNKQIYLKNRQAMIRDH